MSGVLEEAPGELVGERIGLGRTAEVFAYGNDAVVKLLLPGFPEELGETEAAIGELVNSAVPDAPRFRGTVRVGGRLGLVYQRVEGATMLDQLTARPWRYRFLADELARLHAAMHAADGSGLRSLRAYQRHMVGQARGVAPEDAIAAALGRIEALPDGSAVCHGDMHPGNVIRAASGAVVIDWMTARAGPPEADVGRTLFLLTGSAVPGNIPLAQQLMVGLLRRAFARRYLRGYRRLRHLDMPTLRGWRLPILVARLGEGIAEEQPLLLSAIRNTF